MAPKSNVVGKIISIKLTYNEYSATLITVKC